MKKQLLLLSSLFLAGSSFSQVLMNEAFESGLPATWSITTLASDNGWINGTATALSSANYGFSTTNATKFMGTNDDDCNCNKSADRLISPSLDLSATAPYKLTADIFFNKGTYQGKTEVGTIEISTNDGATWTVLRNLTAVADWRPESIDLSAYAGQSNVKISFLYNDGTGWLFGMGVDNVKVFIPQPDDVKLNSVALNRVSLTNTNNTLSINVTNDGSNPITSLEVTWDDGAAQTATIPVNIAAGATTNVNHTTPVNYATANRFDIDVEISLVNGNTDPNPDNNVGSTNITTVSQLAPKKVVIEEGTGTWCMWCPRGAIAMDYMDQNHGEGYIGIAVHNGDPMTVTAYDNNSDFDGYPNAHVDRLAKNIDVSSAYFESYYNTHRLMVPPASVDLSATVNGSSLSIDVSSTFYTNITSANFRLGVILVEDNVTGTGSGYNQSNVYSGGTYGPMGGYENLPNPVPAAQMVYNHVGRALLGGYNGQSGSIASNITDGSTHNYTFNHTIPSAQNINNMKAVAVIINNTTGEIVNANKISLGGNIGVSKAETIDMNIFPNPATDKVNVTFEANGGDYSIEITDLTGRILTNQAVSNANGSQAVEINTSDLNAGNYLLTVSTKGKSFSKMIAIQ